MADKKPRKHSTRTAWDLKDKKRAITVYKGLGSLYRTSDVTGIPYTTLTLWSHSDWWREGLLTLKAEDTSVLEEAATNLAKQAAAAASERLTNGDFVLTRDGELVRKPVGGKDAAIIMGISMQKRRELQDEPTREFALGTTERLLKLVEQFSRFASAKEIKGVLAEAKDDQTQHSQDVLEHNAHHNAEFTKLQEELQTGSSDGDLIQTEAEVGEEHSAAGDDSRGEGQTQ